MTGSPLSGEEFTARLNTITKARLADHHFGVSKLAREMEISRSTLNRKTRAVLQDTQKSIAIIFELPPVGEELHFRFFTVFRLVDGKIAEEWELYQ